MEPTAKGPKELFEEVIDQGLCTLCGACAGTCPYLVSYKGRIVLLDNCTRSDGECYQYCPRTQIDLDEVSRKIFEESYSEDELGTFKEAFIARASDESIRGRAQYGGVVTTLISLAMDSGLIDKAILTTTDDEKVPSPIVASTKEEALKAAGSSYMACTVLEAYNRLSSEDDDKVGIVGVPCQVLALSKMKMDSPKNRLDIDNVTLTIGLFCTWALSPDRFHKFLAESLNLPSVTRFDIPPPPAERFDAYTSSGRVSVGLDEVRKYRMPTCAYCLDMTSEFADISVGSVEGLEGWNTVIVRTGAGADLIERAKAEGIIETDSLPGKNLAHLKEASLHKKKRALKEIVNRTGDRDNLLYVGLSSQMADELLK